MFVDGQVWFFTILFAMFYYLFICQQSILQIDEAFYVSEKKGQWT